MQPRHKHELQCKHDSERITEAGTLFEGQQGDNKPW